MPLWAGWGATTANESRAHRLLREDGSVADAMARWSSRDEDSEPGALGNLEVPESWWRGVTIGSSGSWIVVLVQRLVRRFRAEVVLEIRDDGVAVGRVGREKVIPWESIASIDVDHRYPRSSAGPRVVIQTSEGEAIPVPAVLYPDAESDFPSKRHRDRARTIGVALQTALETERSGQEIVSQPPEPGDV